MTSKQYSIAYKVGRLCGLITLTSFYIIALLGISINNIDLYTNGIERGAIIDISKHVYIPLKKINHNKPIQPLILPSGFIIDLDSNY